MTAQVALSKEFLTAYSKLPRKQQRSVRHFTEKFQENPTSPGINFERINAAADGKVRSVRIDQAYRAIVVHPPKGDVYLLVWVDKHDDAYSWARNRKFEVNPKSGTLQVYGVSFSEEQPEQDPQLDEQPELTPQPKLFDAFDDEDLLLAGVPDPLLVSVRALISNDDLIGVAEYLPEDAAEVLSLMADGHDLISAVEQTESARPKEDKIDVEDFSAALLRPESQRVFQVVEGEDELEAMLEAPLEQWRVFLHPSQRRLVQMNANGPMRVLGGAGTGKTVVLMHRAKHLLDHVFMGDDDRILVTTFTKNLAIDLQVNLGNLCRGKFDRLEVVHLHGWAMRFMKKHGHHFSMITPKLKRNLIDQATVECDDLGFDASFYLEEWDRVLLPQEVDDRDSYFTSRRVGRGTRLTRFQRASAWRVFARYRELLNERGLSEWGDLVRETRMFIENQAIGFPYKAVLTDEVQDFSEVDLKLLRALAPDGPNTLCLVGDGHQRIYGHPTTLSSCGIQIRGRARRLKLNYRTTEQISAHATALLHDLDIDDLDGGLDSLKGYKSLRSGPKPRIELFAREVQEAQFVVQQIREWLEAGVEPESICLAARTHGDLNDRYLPLLTANNIEASKVEQDPVAEDANGGVRVATMHRLKGLEFSRVLLVGVQKGKVPLILASQTDKASEEDQQLRERCLLYVAFTRARDELVVVGYGERSEFLNN